MLFNSFEFIYIFIPFTMAGWVIFSKYKVEGRIGWLLICSGLFYCYWSIHYAVLLAELTVANFYLGRWVKPGNKLRLTMAVCLNLGILGYYKYINFIAENIKNISGYDVGVFDVSLPLGISFFVFQKIAFLTDRFRGQKEAMKVSFLYFATFVWFFPQLIAGPIVHWSCLIRQFRHIKMLDSQRTIFPALCLFAFGLSKKVLIADQLALGVQAYDSAVNYELYGNVSMLTAWLGALFFTFQIYFDFSGYSDMALGLARLFGIRLPLNFWSPYRSKNIIDFWRRWHISLSTFLRDYIYITLGGNRRGSIRRYSNLLVTMLVGGLWHGASWSFVVWGMLHGIYLIIAHLWSSVKINRMRENIFYAGAAWSLTFAAVVTAWVFFKADSLSSALMTVRAMYGGGVVLIPNAIYSPVAEIMGVDFMPSEIRNGPILYGMGPHIMTLCTAAFIAIFLPNTMQILASVRPYWGCQRKETPWQFKFFPRLIAIFVGVLLLISTGAINDGAPFIYYNF